MSSPVYNEIVNITNRTNSDTLYSKLITLIGTLEYSSLGVWILVSNALVLLTYRKVPSVRSRHHLVAVLAGFDFVTGFGAFLKAYILNVRPYSITNRACTLAYIVSASGQTLDPILVFFLAFYRWVGFKFPAKFRLLISQPYLSVVYMTAFSYTGGLFIAGTILSDPNEYVKECGIIEAGVVLTRSISAFVSLSVMMLMIVVNLLLLREVKKHGNESDVDRKQDKHRAESILIISVIYICTNFVGGLVWATVISMKNPGRAQLVNLLITGPMAHVNYGINYYIYYWRTPHYRKLFKPGAKVIPSQAVIKTNTHNVMDLKATVGTTHE